MDPRLTEVRMRSEQIPSKGAYMLGIVRDGTFSLQIGYKWGTENSV